MIEKVVTVKSTEQKPTKKGTTYLSVVLMDDKGKESTFSIFDQGTWELYEENATLKIEIEKEGDFWNIKKVELVKDILQQEALKKVQTEAIDNSEMTKVRSMSVAYSKDYHIARMQSGIETSLVNVLRTAKIIEDYILTGKIIQKEE